MTALVLIDIQQDFMPNGSLPVPNANAIIPFVNKLMPLYQCVIATQDWHPINHISFAQNHFGKKPLDIIFSQGKEQILWQTHCVANTQGANFPSELHTQYIQKIFKKGINPKVDSYSCFFNEKGDDETQMLSFLKKKHITELHFVGVAGDVCVYHSVKDAIALGFKTTVWQKGIRSLNQTNFLTKINTLQCKLIN